MSAFAKVILAIFILFAGSQFSLHEKMPVKSIGVEEDERLTTEYTIRSMQVPHVLSWDLQFHPILPGLFLLFSLSLSKRTRRTINCSPVFHQANYISQQPLIE